MTYLWVNLAVLAVVGLVAWWALRGVAGPVRRRGVLAAGLAMAVSLVFTAVFDSLIIAAGIVGYDRAHLVGWFVGRAPVEDFAYAVAALVLLPALWLAWQQGGER